MGMMFSFFSFLFLYFHRDETDRLFPSIEEFDGGEKGRDEEGVVGWLRYVVSGNGIYGATITNHLIRGEGFPYRALQVSAAISPARAVTLLPGRIRRSAYSICGRWGLTGMRKLAEVNLAVARLDIRRHAPPPPTFLWTSLVIITLSFNRVSPLITLARSIDLSSATISTIQLVSTAS